MKKFLISLVSILIVSGMGYSITASATSVGDVIAYARSIGMPEDMIQSYIAMGSGREYTSEQCDQAIAILSTYSFERDDAISSGEEKEVEPVEPEVFEQMPIDEKKDYITSIPQEDKQEYLDYMTNEEKNQLLKELDITQQVEVISSMLGFGEAFGYDFSIEDISDGYVMISARDENQKLVGVTVLGDSVEKTGKPYTLPILTATGMMLLSVGGMAYIMKRTGKE